MASAGQSAEKDRQAQDIRLVLHTIPTLAWSARPDGSAEFFSRRWLDYTGLSAEEASDWGWTVAFHPEDRESLKDFWSRLLAAGEAVEIEARLRRYDGEYRWFLIRAEPVRDSHGNIFASGPGGIFIFNLEGKLLGRLNLENATSNCALSPDEKTLYVTNDMYVLRVKMR